MSYRLSGLLGSAIIALGTSAIQASAAAVPGQGITTTKLYKLELDIGMPAQMYTKAQVASEKPKTGEIMVSGKMIGMGATATTGNHMSMPADMRHLELHVYSKTTGKPVENAKVAITITSLELKKPDHLPIAVMYGIKAGTGDWHYGNNVTMPPGTYHVSVRVNGEQANFKVTMPAS